eukprot:3031134-Prymnesium_polylepis.3
MATATHLATAPAMATTATRSSRRTPPRPSRRSCCPDAPHPDHSCTSPAHPPLRSSRHLHSSTPRRSK